jgi:endonuclease YncB( thermonuclease family)
VVEKVRSFIKVCGRKKIYKTNKLLAKPLASVQTMKRGLLLAALTLYGCGEEPCEDRTTIIFDQEDLGRKSWDGDSYWLQRYEEKVRLVGVDYPNISGTNSLENCRSDNCETWTEAFGTLNIDNIKRCYIEGLEIIEQKLQNKQICVTKDTKRQENRWGTLLRYIKFDNFDHPTDLGGWLINVGYAIPNRDDCDYCDEYQELVKAKNGCLWEQ